MVDEQRIMWTRFSMLFRPMFRSYVMLRKGKVAPITPMMETSQCQGKGPNWTEQVIWLSNTSFEKNSFNWESCFASELKYIHVIDILKKTSLGAVKPWTLGHQDANLSPSTVTPSSSTSNTPSGDSSNWVEIYHKETHTIPQLKGWIFTGATNS